MSESISALPCIYPIQLLMGLWERQLKDLPEIDVDKVEADTYYKDKSGALHLVEVKNTPNAFVSKLKETADNGQFDRYRQWIEKGSQLKPLQVREVTVYVKNTQPKFHEIIDKRTLNALKESISHFSQSTAILEIGEKKFSYDELQEFYKAADKKLRKLVKEEQKLNPNVNIRELIGALLDEHFDSMEKAFEIMGKEYGH